MPAVKCRGNDCKLCEKFIAADKWKSFDRRVVIPVRRSLNCQSSRVFFIVSCKKCRFRAVSYTITSLEEEYLSYMLKINDDNLNLNDEILNHMLDCSINLMFFTPIHKINPKNNSLNIKALNVLKAILDADWDLFGKLMKERRSFKILPPDRYKINYVPYKLQLGYLVIEARECFGTLPRNRRSGTLSVLSHKQTHFTSFSLNDPHSMEDELFDLQNKTHRLYKKLLALHYKLLATNKRLLRAGRKLEKESQDKSNVLDEELIIKEDNQDQGQVIDNQEVQHQVNENSSHCSWYVLENVTTENNYIQASIISSSDYSEKKTVSLEDVTLVYEIPTNTIDESIKFNKRKSDESFDVVMNRKIKLNGELEPAD